MKIRLTVSPQAERYVRRDGPVEVRRMAARGALPANLRQLRSDLDSIQPAAPAALPAAGRTA